MIDVFYIFGKSHTYLLVKQLENLMLMKIWFTGWIKAK